MIKLKKLMTESVWNRKFGEPLPTLEDTMKAHQRKTITEWKWSQRTIGHFQNEHKSFMCLFIVSNNVMFKRYN